MAANAAAVFIHGAAAHPLERPVNVMRLALHPRSPTRPGQDLVERGRHIVESLLQSPDPTSTS